MVVPFKTGCHIYGITPIIGSVPIWLQEHRFNIPVTLQVRFIQSFSPPDVFKGTRNNVQNVLKFLVRKSKWVRVILCCANRLQQRNTVLKLPEGEVQHNHFKALLEHEEMQAGLRAVPELMKLHIAPNGF